MTDAARLSAALSDRYRIERELGQGGMATVYLAHDVRHDRRVALKVLRPELAAILGAERFLAEIKTTANLQHPHILSLFDSGEAEGLVFYVMPYVEGESLRDRLTREKQLPVEEAVRIAKEVADALEYAHQHGIVHRDIKPENILLHGGHAMVADFGIALAAARSDGGTRMTETGMSLGTPHYMSPEQAMGEREITPRADIYALGCVLYEMLTAEPPFTGATAQAIIARVMTEEPRSLTIQRRTVPRHIEAATRRALEKLPADRFARAADFAAALGDASFAGPMASAAPAGATATRSRLVMAGAGALGALLLVASGVAAGRWSAPDERPLAQFYVLAPDSVTGFSRCCGRALALSPDGRTLVFIGVRRGQASAQLYRRESDRLDAEAIPGTDNATIPFFSPDGRWVGFFADGRLRKVPLAGGPTLPIGAAEQVSGASWGDNDVIVFSQNGRLFRVPAAGGQGEPIAGADTSSRILYPFVLPGSRAALVSLRQLGAGLEGARIGLVDLEQGGIDTLAFGGRAEYAGGYLVYSGSDNTLLAQPFDAGRGTVRGEAVALLSRVFLAGSSNHEFTVSPQGALAYIPGSEGRSEELRHSGPGGRATIPLPGRGDVNLEDPAVSPDGRVIALRLVASGGQGGADIWLLDRQQQTLERFTVGGGHTPTWSRDGRRLAYAAESTATGPAGLYARATDQTGTPQLVWRHPAVNPGGWLPDGRSIVFQAVRGTSIREDIGLITIGDSTPRWLVATTFRESQPQVSPDGRWLAYASNRTGRFEVYAQAMDSGAATVQISTEGGGSPRWSPDGRTLYYVNGTSIIAATLTFAPTPRTVSRRTVVDGGVTDLNGTNSNWDIFPNGREFIYIDLLGEGANRMAWIQHWPEILRQMSTDR